MKISEDVRKYAAEQQISEDEALSKGMEEPSEARSTIQWIARQAKRSGVKKHRKSPTKAPSFTPRHHLLSSLYEDFSRA